MIDKVKIAIDALTMISKVCEGNVYLLDDDEFGDIMFMRDLADEALMKLKEKD